MITVGRFVAERGLRPLHGALGRRCALPFMAHLGELCRFCLPGNFCAHDFALLRVRLYIYRPFRPAFCLSQHTPRWELLQAALRLDALETSHPIKVVVSHPDEINEIFDTISYAKVDAV